MTGFAPDWLALREPYDRKARDETLLDRLAAWARAQDPSPLAPLVVADLGGGTGSTLRAVAPTLGVPQTWHILDHDPALVATGSALSLPPGVPSLEARWHQADLTGDLAASIPEVTALVTASALLDLVSADWLARLAALVQARGLAFYAALTYDGRQRWNPIDPFDADALDRFDRHQKGKKSFGPALGPDAPARLRLLLEGRGAYAEAPSDWRLGPDDRALQAAVLDGWAGAIEDAAPGDARGIQGWHAARLRHVEAGRSRLVVGHKDQLWLPG
ncbi:MAG: hypothetical protein KDG89_17100 [Geminicoccaceae bacterium]|nr:hypothetical protein [Geminicoccaceae bacterium]